jgi:signal transduction histidine kinase
VIRPRRGQSLFWTIAGVFLLTIALGTLAQWIAAGAVLRPLELHDARGRAEMAAAGVASGIAALPASASEAEIDTVLVRHRANLDLRPAWIVYRTREGGVRSAPPWRERRIADALAGRLPPEPPPEGAQRPPFFRMRLEVLAHHAVSRGGEVLGEVLVIRPGRPPGGFGQPGSPTPLLFLPIALIASACAGLVMVRILVRRLRAIEALATRVADGDLSVRIRDESGDEIGRLAEQLDLMTDRLAEARGRLEEAGHQRRQLFADITHELATPLTSIRGYTETLLDPDVPLSTEERARYLRSVLEEARRLDRLISDLFDLARLEAGASPLSLEPIDWAALCRNTTERFEPRFRDAGLRLVWRESPEAALIEADGHRMEQVLENLLVNALRYVPQGGTVEVSLRRRGNGTGRYRLTVSDDGPGLPPDELPRLFERFYRAAGVRGPRGARDQGGSGLGLAIVREIVERHGGTASAEARSPHGLTIALELPAKG